MGIAHRDSASGDVYYLFQDPLDSLRMIADAFGNAVRQIEYDPWGREVVDSGTVDDSHRFAGMEKDGESGLYHTWYRKYSTIFGRWLSPDPERCGPSNPQAWNMYAYVLDNPTNLTDPLGLQQCGFGPFGCSPPIVSRGPYPSPGANAGCDYWVRVNCDICKAGCETKRAAYITLAAGGCYFLADPGTCVLVIRWIQRQYWTCMARCGEGYCGMCGEAILIPQNF